MSAKLARVLRDSDLSGPRGPDGKLTITVPPAWLAEERWIELDLPRTLTCAACEGGGCDGCGRSGAVDTRGRKELGEVLEVRLPASEAAVVVRLPKRGGLPLDAGDLSCRGILLLAIVPGAEPSRGVRVREVPLAAIVVAPARRARSRWILVAAAVIAAVVLIWLLLRR